VKLRYPLANCQTDARTMVFRLAVQPLKDFKDFILVLRLNPDPVIRDRDQMVPPAASGTDLDDGRNFASPVFHSILDKI
jgi:hypothetical protein